MHGDGELFWWLTHGIEAPEGGLAMPGFARTLSDQDRWNLIDYIHAHNAGIEFNAHGTWSPPVQAPGFQARCEAGRLSLAELGSGFVRVVIGTVPPAAVPGVTTVLATTGPAALPSPGLCIADEEDVVRAYAIISGTTAAALPGTEFLIDGSGWLRAVQRPSAKPGWDDPATLEAEIHQLGRQPIVANPGGSHAQMQM